MPLYEMPAGVETRWASHENPEAAKGRGALRNRGAKGAPYLILEPGETEVLMDIDGPGTVRRIWLTLDHPHPEALRYIRLEMYWDGAETPAVCVPLGDFFGNPLGQGPRFENAYFANPEGRSCNSTIPMPFKTHGRIQLVNEMPSGEDHNRHRIFYDVDLTLGDAHGPDTLYFHAFWRRERPTQAGRDFEILPRVEGRGRFLGAHIGLLCQPGNIGWFGEGETKVYLDGDREHPTLCGTGTEDWIGTAWGQGVFSHRHQGAWIADFDRGRHAFYRYHGPDPVYFHEDIRVTLQQMGGTERPNIETMRRRGLDVIPTAVIAPDRVQHNLLDGTTEQPLEAFGNSFTTYYREDDVAGTAFFYLDRPENGLGPLAPMAERTAPRYVPESEAGTVVLTFDDACRSHLEVVAPLLHEYGFGATFFVTSAWMEHEKEHLSWDEIAELHYRGFEVGNHTATHLALDQPEAAAKLAGELEAVERELERRGVPRPVSFGWPGNAFGPEALAVLREKGYRFARRGIGPDPIVHGMGPTFEPHVNDPLLIPSTTGAGPNWTEADFRRVVEAAQPGRVAVVQFHGVPDLLHDFVGTEPDVFRAFLDYLKEKNCRVLALRDLETYIDPDRPVHDPRAETRYDPHAETY